VVVVVVVLVVVEEEGLFKAMNESGAGGRERDRERSLGKAVLTMEPHRGS
jgi:hypothetical protein